MGDNFFKAFFFGLFGLIFLVGLLTFLHMEKQSSEIREQRQFIESRGAVDIPPSWRGKIGKGI